MMQTYVILFLVCVFFFVGFIPPDYLETNNIKKIDLIIMIPEV